MGVVEQLLVHWRSALFAAIPLIGLYLYRRFARPSNFLSRKRLAQLPQPDGWTEKDGHWSWVIASATAEGYDERRSFDLVLYEQAEKMGFPPVLFVDWRPKMDLIILFIFDHNVAEQVTKSTKKFSNSIPKDPAIMRNLSPLVGKRSLVNLDGDEWKNLRKRIIPGFQPKHLVGLAKVIVDKTAIFVDHLERLAQSGEEFRVDELTTNLAFDVTGIVTFNVELNAQIPGKQSPVLLSYRALQEEYVKRDMTKHWLRRYFTENERKIRKLDNELDTALKTVIRKEHEKVMNGDKQHRSVATLSLSGVETLTPEILQQTSDTCRGFMFAGHDTTSILMQYVFYEIARRPASREALKKELDSVFGPDPSPASVMSQLSGPANGELMGRLSYTDAIIKEALRLHPPGGTVRLSPQGAGTTLTMPDGEQLLVDGLILSPMAYVIQRDPKIFGETRDDFMPERWLGSEGAKIPDSAFRPYERGPRRCTGQELANMESRIILAVVARRFDWIKIGMGEFELNEEGSPILDEKGYYKTKSVLIPTDEYVTDKPIDGMLMKIKINERALAYAN